jgi:hypothetical protein
MLDMYREKSREDCLKDLTQKAAEERDGNDAELNLSYGRLVTYGERIQLRHIHSDSFMTTSEKIA